MTVLPFPLRPPPPDDDDPGEVVPSAQDPRAGRGDIDVDVLSLLVPWREGGVLSDADLHGAEAMCRACGIGADRPSVVLAAALALRAPRLGHTCLDLATVARSAPAEVEGERGLGGAGGPASLDALPWPTDLVEWRSEVERSALVAGVAPPLVLEGRRLYLERYHRYEVVVADEVRRRAGAPSSPLALDPARQAELLDALLPLHDGAGAGPLDGTDAQRRAAVAATTHPVAVIVGGPGTGKTHTVAALLGLLLDDARGDLRIALAAPTGKAAARLGESLRQRADALRASGVSRADELADRLEAAEVATLHRLLGARPGTTRFRHHAGSPLVDDIVIVDETSMVALPLMARLLDALRPDARLVLVGDPGQLASVEAGSVLGDLAGPVVDALLAGVPTPAGPLTDAVTVLTQSFRFPSGSAIDRFASAVRAGDADAAEAALRAAPVGPAPSTAAITDHEERVEEENGDPDDPAVVQGVLSFAPMPAPASVPASASPRAGAPISSASGSEPRAGAPISSASGSEPRAGSVSEAEVGVDDVQLRWIASSGDGPDGRSLVAPEVGRNASRVRGHAERGDAQAALDALAEVRVLCAHRRGPFGVSGWNRLVESWLSADRPLAPGFYVGRPILVTANDRTNGVFNGDLGVTVATPEGARVVFPASDGPRPIAPVRLESVETVHAMTIHKSQGSEFDHVVVVLPPAASRLATRELLYTAVTHARRRVTLVGPAEAVRAAVENRVERASGLAERLWSAPTEG